MNVKKNWNILSPNCPPVAFLLKNNLRDKWVRFHNLPESKRYPESPNEYKIILDRNSSVLNYLSDSNDIFYIFGPLYPAVSGWLSPDMN